MLEQHYTSLSKFIYPQRKILCFLLLLLIGACSSTPTTNTPSEVVESNAGSPEYLIQQANSQSGTESIDTRLAAIELLIAERDYSRANQQFSLFPGLENLDLLRRESIAKIGAAIGLESNNPDFVLEQLLSLPASSQSDPQLALFLGQAYLMQDQPLDAFRALSNAEGVGNASDLNLPNTIWSALSRLSNNELDDLASSASNYQTRGWIELARTINNQNSNIQRELNAIAQWQRIWSSHSAAEQLPDALTHLEEVWQSRPRQIALLLPLQESAGIAIQEGFMTAYFEAMETTRDVPKIDFYDSTGITNIYPLYDRAVANGADLIIGPLNKSLVNQLQRLPEIPVTTLALNYTDDIENLTPNRFFQFGLAPEDEINQAVGLAKQKGFVNAAIITPTGQDYARLSNLFENSWVETGGELVSRTTYDSASDYAEVIKRLMAIDSSERRADEIKELLPRNQIEFTPRRRQDIDFIYLIANPRQGRQIKPTLAFYFAENLPVFAYPSIYDGASSPESNRDLDGITILDAPWLLDRDESLKLAAIESLRNAGGALQRLRAMGIDSFKLHTRLTQLENAELSKLNGATGVLTMNSMKRIQRQLDIAEFNEGVPEIRNFSED